VSTEYDAVHERLIAFIDQRYWIVSDSLRSASRHDYAMRLQLSPAAQGVAVLEKGAWHGLRSPGLVVAVEPADFPLDLGAWQAAFGNEDGARYAAEAAALGAGQPARVHPLAGIVFQRALESRAFDAGGGNYDAPAQRVEDFLAARPSQAIGAVQPSYRPGVRPGDLAEVLPGYAVQAMREALPVFGRQIAGYDMPDALMTAVETRTSSPLRIARGAADFQSPSLRGLYPAGEGAGYAGGILSAGVDGIRVAEAVGVSMARAPAR
jgi:hypothetical protein